MKQSFTTAGQHPYSLKKKINLDVFLLSLFSECSTLYMEYPSPGWAPPVLRCSKHLRPELSDLQLSQSGWLPTKYTHCQAFCITECFKQLQSFNLLCVSTLKVSHKKGTLDHPDLINIGFSHLSVYHFQLIIKIMYVNKIWISCSATLPAEKQLIN